MGQARIKGGGGCSPLAAPSDLTVSRTCNAHELLVEWTDNSADNTDQELQISPDGEELTPQWLIPLQFSGGVGANTESILVPGLDSEELACWGTTWSFRARSIRQLEGCPLEVSEWSNIGTETPIQFEQPTNLVATPISGTQIGLSWDDNSDNEDHFEIERSLDGIGGWAVVLSPAANETSDVDTGLDLGTQYFYRIRAAGDGFGELNFSCYSDIANATTESEAQVAEDLVAESFGFYDEDGMLTSAVIHGVNTGVGATRYSISHASQVGLDISTEDFVVQAWICRDQESTQSRILGKGNINTTDLGYSLEVTNNVVKFRIGDGTSSAEVTGTIAYRRWHHIMASADRDGNIELFIDGVSTGTAAALAATIANAVDYRMMTTDDSGTRRFRGYMSMCGVWSGVTIDAVGALALFNSGIPVNYDAMTAGQKSGLVSFWELNENINGTFGRDRLGVNDLTRQNVSGSDGFRHFHKPAAQFIAADSQYLEIDHVSQSGLSPGAIPFTFVTWVRGGTPSIGRAVAGKWVEGTDDREWVMTIGSDNKLYFSVSIDGVGVTSVNMGSFGTTPAVSYSLLVCVWDGVDIKLSMNGSAFVTAAFAGPVYGLGVAPFRIGSYNATNFMDGDISNAAFWGRALPLTEIQNLAKSIPSEYPLEYEELTASQKTDLVSWWKLEEKTGTRVDAHGSNDLNQNNGVGHAEGIVPDPAAEYPAPENAAVTAWTNRSTVADANKFGDLRVIRAGFAPRKHATLMLDWNDTAGGGFHTFLGRVSQPGTVIVLGSTSGDTGNDQYWFDGYYPGMSGTVDRWAGSEGDPGTPMRMFAGSAVDSGLTLAGGQTLWIWIFDGVDSEFHQDAVSADPIPSSPGANDLVGLSVGARYDVSSGHMFIGSMKLVVVLERRLTPSEITNLIADLNP